MGVLGSLSYKKITPHMPDLRGSGLNSTFHWWAHSYMISIKVMIHLITWYYRIVYYIKKYCLISKKLNIRFNICFQIKWEINVNRALRYSRLYFRVIRILSIKTTHCSKNFNSLPEMPFCFSLKINPSCLIYQIR